MGIILLKAFVVIYLITTGLILIETTARSIAVTIALLSIHNDLQEETYEHIISVIGYERDPVSCGILQISGYHNGVQVYDDYTKLNKVFAVFFESMRMFRTLPIIFKARSKCILTWAH